MMLTTGFTAAAPMYLFRAGDFVQKDRGVYIVTQDVYVTPVSGTSYTVYLHRQPMGNAGGAFAVGEYGNVSLGGQTYVGVTFPVILQEYPTYTLNPFTNDSFIEWTGNFVAMESIL